MVKRIDCLGILSKSTAPKAVTARVENINLGHCPICNVAMPTVLVGSEVGTEVLAYVCLEHCVCLPTKN